MTNQKATVIVITIIILTGKQLDDIIQIVCMNL